ncbi:MAG: xanthine dehydrogenase family protein molybdopterin-binding subunit [Bacillota bacterium]|nr:xanthine dehydrogenase family protein molybdopterin-binding subunit [Bacillota bacterium]
MRDEFNVVGKSVNRSEALAKATGRLKYTSDLKTDDMLVAKALFAKYPHANILKIDTSKAEQLEGVEAVMTAKDLPGRNGYGILFPDKPVIADKKVRYEGDPVAIVAAVNEKIAKQAIKLIEVEYEVLKAYDDPREAMKDDAILIHENHGAAEKGNILNTVRQNKGDVEKAFAEADVIIEDVYETPMLDHTYLEPDVCIAEYDPVSRGLNLISPQQAVYATKRVLAPVFGLPHSKVRTQCPAIGGGFGGKEDSVLDVASVAGVLALKTKKTVIFELTREEVFRATGKRHATYIKHRIAATKDGKIIGVDSETVLDKGAYVSMGGVNAPAFAVTMRTAMYAAGTYAVPNVRAVSYSVFTNHPYGCAFRGFGVPQITFAMESQICNLASELKMDPIEIRKINMVKDGDTTGWGQVMKESRGLGLGECLDKVKEKMDWGKPFHRGNGPIKVGRGVGAFIYGTGIPLLFEGSMAYVILENDGTASVSVSSTEMGQGHITAMAQIAAETLGIRYEDVEVSVSDSGRSPDAGPTVGSRATTLVGNAVKDGCTKIKNRILEFAQGQFGEDERDLDVKDGKVYVVGKPEIFKPLAEIASKAFVSQIPLSAVGNWYPPQPSFDEDGQGNPMHAYTFGAHGIELEVDTETGDINILKSVLAIDVGKAINPSTVEGQMEGGASMGIGWAIMEEEFMKDGVMKNASFHDFLIPTTKDLPRLESVIVEHSNELGPYGAKGVGEPPLIPAAPAVRNAIFDAIGIRMNTIPFTPVRVMEAIKNNEKKED